MNREPSMPRISRRNAMFGLFALATASGTRGAFAAAGAGDARSIPPMAGAEPASAALGLETAVLAGGCFWGVQGVFQHVRGVTDALSGYAGGDQRGATYAAVSSGATRHAESVRVTFDPRQISYAQILQIFFSVAHDPTQLNRQGPDHGTQYRSAIFPANAEQAAVASGYIAQLDKARVFPAPIVTTIESGHAFYPAEDYHQDFLARNPRHPYIVYNDLPKLADLKRLFPVRYRPDPILVSSRKAG